MCGESGLLGLGKRVNKNAMLLRNAELERGRTGDGCRGEKKNEKGRLT
jgi:hypothetical protein